MADNKSFILSKINFFLKTLKNDKNKFRLNDKNKFYAEACLSVSVGS